MIKVGDYGFFNEYQSNIWSKYENKIAEVVDADIENLSLFIKFEDGFILEVDYKEFVEDILLNY